MSMPLKDLLVEMAMTPWFRADSTAVTLDAKDELRLEAAVRVSLCHYNTIDEVRSLLATMKEIAG